MTDAGYESLELELERLENQLREVEKSREICRETKVFATPVEKLRLSSEERVLGDEISRLEDTISRTRAKHRELKLGIQSAALEEAARNCENVDALDQAIALWRELLILSPGNVVATDNVTRINATMDRRNRYSGLVARLTPFLANRQLETTLYQTVVKVLKVAHKSVTAESHEAQLVQRLVDGQLPPEEFARSWAAVQMQNDLGTTAVDFGALAGRLSRGELVVMVGSILQSPDELADALAVNIGTAVATARRTRFSPPSEVAEYCEMNGQYGTLDLVRRVASILPRGPTNPRLFELLAKIARPILVISATHDDFLEQAFKATGKKYVIVSPVVNGTPTIPAGKLIVRYSDNDTSLPPMDDQTLSHEAPMDKGYSVLFKVRGVCDAAADASDPIHRTFTLSECRYFEFARQGDTQIPNYVAKHFSGRALLVMGYRPAFWEDRLVLSAVIDRFRSSGERSLVVSTDHTGFAGDYWQSRGVSRFPYSLDDFVANLEEATA